MPCTVLLDPIFNSFCWLDLYTATIIMDNKVMKPKVMHTTAALENSTAEEIRETASQIGQNDPRSYSIKDFDQKQTKNNIIPLDFGASGLHMEPSQFPHNNGFPIKLKHTYTT